MGELTIDAMRKGEGDCSRTAKRTGKEREGCATTGPQQSRSWVAKKKVRKRNRDDSKAMSIFNAGFNTGCLG